MEYQRLQRTYDDAIVVWEQDRHPSVQPINRDKFTNEEAAELRNQALLKRNVAANELYTLSQGLTSIASVTITVVSLFDWIKAFNNLDASLASTRGILWESSKLSNRKGAFPMPRLLCVGKEPELLEIRCAVLESAGYSARSVTLEEAKSLLRTSEFDLVIVSAWLSEWERGRILSAAGETPTLVLTEVTLAHDLLAKVERMLDKPRDMTGASNHPG